MTIDDLLAALTVERYANRWWTRTTPAPKYDDSELTCARRMRDALADEDAMSKEKTA